MCGLLALLARASGLASAPLEAFLVALAVALSSTSTVLTTLVQARLRDTVYGKTVIELMAVQDLFMAPLLAIPTAITEILYKYSGLQLVHVLGAYGVGIAGTVLLSRRLLPRVLATLAGGAPGDAGAAASATRELFGLGVVSYAMAMSLLADRFSLSHEAGALFAGLVLIGTPHVKQAAQAVKPLTSLFGGMYLASLGLIMSPGYIGAVAMVSGMKLRPLSLFRYIGAHVGAISAHVACVFGLKLGVVGLTMRALGFSWSAALAAGATLAQISEVSLFMVARAQQLGLLSRGAFSHLSSRARDAVGDGAR